jgi:hypothetical protein
MLSSHVFPKFTMVLVLQWHFRRETFNHLASCLKEVKNFVIEGMVTIMLVGNKCDLFIYLKDLP